MAQFVDLPLELLSKIIGHIVKPHHLALCCLVNRTFSSSAVQHLYEKIYIFAWQKQGKSRVMQLFDTLSKHPELAKWVKKLELRDFPKAYPSQLDQPLSEKCLHGLANCASLRSCTWTRDQTLSSEILSVLSLKCPELRELEINGNSTGSYDPNSLLLFTSLTKISIIMPSAEVIDVLPTWVEKTANSLTALHITCKSSKLVTDSTLANIANYAIGLKSLHITGCPRVTQKGIHDLLARNSTSIESLGLEGLSPNFDLGLLAKDNPPLISLTSLTLTIPPSSAMNDWFIALLRLINNSSLAEFHLYATGSQFTATSDFILTPEFISLFLAHHAATLRKFSVLMFKLQPELIGMICASCPNLHSFFLFADNLMIDEIVCELARSHTLCNIHVNLSTTFGLDSTGALAIARKLGPGVRQLGLMTHVYQINRVARRKEDGEVTIDMELTKYEHPEVPEQFLVLRT